MRMIEIILTNHYPMTTKINIIYSLAEDNLTASEVERLISELEILQEIKEKQEATPYTQSLINGVCVMQSSHISI